MNRPKRSPWGAVDHFKLAAEGIAWVSTPGHGGLKLDRERNAAMPLCARRKGGWYEEDCEWALVALVFPNAFTEDQRTAAKRTALNYYPDVYTEVTGEEATPECSRELRRRLWLAATRDSFVVRSACGASHEAVPPGYVGVTARRESDGETALFLVGSLDYGSNGRTGPNGTEFGYVVPLSAEPWDDQAVAS